MMLTSRRSFAVLPLLLAVLSPLVAQTIPPDPFSMGTTYVLAFPDTVGNERDLVFADTRFNDVAVVMIYSPVPNRVRITGSNGIARWSTSLPAGRISSIDLMRPEFNDPFGPIAPNPAVQRKPTYRLETDYPVIVYCYVLTAFGMEAWTPLPVEAWGTEYYAAAFAGEVVRNVYYVSKTLKTRAQAAPSEIVIVAAYDNTVIAAYPNGPVIAPPSLITLQANQAFQLRSFVDTNARSDVLQSDLGGSYVVSTKPIGVLSGSTRTAVIDERAGVTKNAVKNMAVEWLSPADAHGKSMVMMPVWDDLRVLGTKGEPLSTKRPGEVVRVYGSSATPTIGTLTSPIEAPRPINVAPAVAQTIRIDGYQTARWLSADAPLQAMHSPAGVIRAASGGGYDTWGSFMTELVPHEQWTSFAPYYAPTTPIGMRHYINVVTDSLHIDDIYIDGRRTRPNMGVVPKSDFVWGTFEITVGQQHYIEGRNGATFSAVVYGLVPGSEKTLSTTYREYLGLSYGYALAPARRALNLEEAIRVDSVRDCNGLAVSVFSGSSVATVRRVALDSASNVRVEPSSVLNGPMITPIAFRLQPIDPTKDAHGILLVEDRAGVVRRIEFVRPAENAVVVPSSGVAFGEAMAGDSLHKVFTLVNTSTAPLTVRSVSLASGTAGIALDDSATTPVLAPGEELQIAVHAQPTGAVRVIRDTAIVSFNCTQLRLPLSVSVVEPCVEIGDLDFESVSPNAFVARDLQVCNRGRGRLRLLEIAGDSSLVWNNPSFTVNPVYLELLRTTTLLPGQCVTIQVLFSSSRPGRYETIGWISPSAGSCRDSSVWTATVMPLSSVEQTMAGDVSFSADIEAENRVVRFEIASVRQTTGRLVIYDGIGRIVAVLVDRPLEPGVTHIQWKTSEVPSGQYYASLIVNGNATVQRIVIPK